MEDCCEHGNETLGSIKDANFLSILRASDKSLMPVYGPEGARGKASTVVISTTHWTLFHSCLCSTKIQNSGSLSFCAHRPMLYTFALRPLPVSLHIQHSIQAIKILDFGRSRSIRRLSLPDFLNLRLRIFYLHAPFIPSRRTLRFNIIFILSSITFATSAFKVGKRTVDDTAICSQLTSFMFESLPAKSIICLPL